MSHTLSAQGRVALLNRSKIVQKLGKIQRLGFLDLNLMVAGLGKLAEAKTRQ
jgi:hypothetical protein